MSPETQTLADLKSLTSPAAAPAAVAAEPKIDKQGRAYATGKRKNAVARVWLKPGAGRIVVNGSEVLVYFARPVLKAGGFLTRDSRVVERKKYGRRKARRSFQFSKR